MMISTNLSWLMDGALAALRLAVILIAFPAIAQVQQTVAAGKLAAGETVVTPAIAVMAGQQITVRAQSDAEGFVIEPAIHDSEKRLLEKDDPDGAASDAFRWTALESGTYYVLVRNLSQVEGEYTVSLSSPMSLPKREDKPYAQVQVFYATSRQRINDAKQYPFYGSEVLPDSALEYGKAFVSIPREHRMGLVESPVIRKLLDPARHVTILGSPQQLDASVFFDQVRNPKREALVYVHGFNTDFPGAIQRLAQIKYDLGFEGEAVAFTWPSQGRIGVAAYGLDREAAIVASKRLREFLTKLAAESRLTAVHVIAHSMGNVVLTRALSQMTTDERTRASFGQIAFMAPDVDAAEFRKFAASFQVPGGGASRLTLYASSKDAALIASSMYWKGARAGQAGAGLIVVPKLLNTVDASSVDTSLLGVNHQYFADNSTVLSDVYHLIRNIAPENRFLRVVKDSVFELPDGCR